MLHEKVAEAVEERAVYYVAVDNDTPKFNCKTRPVESHGWSPGKRSLWAHISQENFHRAQEFSNREHPACWTISLTARILHD